MAMDRNDDYDGVMAFKDMYKDGVALIVLGGPSGAAWKKIKDDFHPDTILGANGACFEISDLDFHMVAENMHMADNYAKQGQQRYKEIMRIFTTKHQARTRLISCLSWDLLEDTAGCVSIRRWGEADPNGYDRQIQAFNVREYGEGFLHGRYIQKLAALKRGVKFRVGTVAAHLLHMAGILGVREVHTIGFDMCLKDEQRHHWYKYPTYQVDRSRQEGMFTEYGGLRTQWDWLEGAIWLAEEIEPLFRRDGMTWHDHSNGLLKVIGMRGAV